MADTSTTPNPSETPADKKKRKLAEQDQQMANELSAALTMIETARDDAEIQALIAPKGYAVDDLDDAVDNLQAPAQAAYNARQTAIGVARRATENLSKMEAEERKDFADFRETARAVFPGKTDWTSLGLNGAAPKDLQKFLTAAKSSYDAGKKAPYTAGLTKRGYSPAAIDAQLAGIKSVSDLSKTQGIAAGAAQKATTTRDTNFKALQAWTKEFRKIVKRTLRERPDLAGKLEL
jgi:hypothetical protein